MPSCCLFSFLNCILQALASLPSFTLYLEQLYAVVQSAEAPTLPRPASAALTNASFVSRLSTFLSPSRSFMSAPPSSSELLRHFLFIQTGRQRDPSPLYRLLTREAVQFRGFRQQDAHELLLAILDLFDKRSDRVQQLRAAMEATSPRLQPTEETKEADSGDTAAPFNKPTDPFVGSTSQFLVCLACSYSSPPTRTSFNSLTLPLPPSQYHSLLSPVPLLSCINDYTSNERVDGVRCAMCGALETRTACVVQLTLMANSDKEWTDRRRERYKRLAEQCRAMEQRMHKLDSRLAKTLLSNAAPLPSTPPAVVASQIDEPLFSLTAPALAEHAVPRSCIKKVLLSQLPTVLCIHLNRLYGDRKLSTRVTFDRSLDLSHFTPAIRLHHSRADDRSCVYRLCSVVCHHGGAVGGHYTCYRQHDRYQAEEGSEQERQSKEEQGGQAERSEKDTGTEERKEMTAESADGQTASKLETEERKEAMLDALSGERPKRDVDRVWVHVSDDEVRKVSWREVANCEAYMLFYEKET